MNRILTVAVFLLSTLLLSTINSPGWSTTYANRGWYRELVETPATGVLLIEVSMSGNDLYEKITTTRWEFVAGVKGPLSITEEYYWSTRLNPSQFKTKYWVTRSYTNSPSNGSVVTYGLDTPLRLSGLPVRIGNFVGSSTNGMGNIYLRTVDGDFSFVTKPGPLPHSEDSYALYYWRVQSRATLEWHRFCTGYRFRSDISIVIHPSAGEAWPCLGSPPALGNAASWAPGGILWPMGKAEGWWSQYPGQSGTVVNKTASDPEITIPGMPDIIDVSKGFNRSGGSILVINPEVIEQIIESSNVPRYPPIPPEEYFNLP